MPIFGLESEVDLEPDPYGFRREELDRQKTGRWRCIGCGKFLRNDLNWNQCADCDTRDPEDYF